MKFVAVIVLALLAIAVALIAPRYESTARDYYGRRCAELLPSDDMDIARRVCVASALNQDPLASFLIGLREGYQSASTARRPSP